MKTASRIYTAIIFAILYLPIIVLILFSFNKADGTSVFAGFSLRWYKELFRNAEAFNALKNTLILAITSSLAATVIGTGAAVGLSRMKNKVVKASITSATNIPMMNPDIVTGVSMMLLFVVVGKIVGVSGDKLNFWTIFIAHVTFNLPYVILNINPRIKQMDKSLTEAALDLGCTPVKAFFKVELPFILPGIIAGLIMAFTLSLDDFVISYFTSGNDFQTLPILIYSMTKKKVTPDMYALSSIIVVSVLVLLILSNTVGTKKTKVNGKQR